MNQDTTDHSDYIDRRFEAVAARELRKREPRWTMYVEWALTAVAAIVLFVTWRLTGSVWWSLGAGAAALVAIFVATWLLHSHFGPIGAARRALDREAVTLLEELISEATADENDPSPTQ